MNLAEVEAKVNRLKARREQAERNAERERAAVTRIAATVKSIEEARTINQAVAEEMQRRAHDKIARVVTRCLAAVFDDPYEFSIRFDKKRGKTEAVLEFRRDGQVLDDPINEVGGGVLDVAALALRLSCLMVGKPAPRRALLLDEPFGNIRGEQNKRRTAELLSALADEFDMQIVLNTDIPTYRAGTVIEMGEQ